MPAPLLEIKNLSTAFRSGNEIHDAVKNISLQVYRGETLAIVGESGSGKSVTALSILQLLASNAIIHSGAILFTESDGIQKNLLQKKQKELQAIRGNSIGMIFQEPMTSLNPVFTCGHQVAEAIRIHKKQTAKKARKQAIEWFEKVKLPDPENIYNRYPHQLSGGQKQRVMIAMAMCCHPALLICDEPTTALDVSVQKTILQLIKDLQQQENIGVIFITHDLGVVAEVADRAVVMYKGEIVEENVIDRLFRNPQHPYTKGLLACRPVLHQKGERLPVVSDFINGQQGSPALPVSTQPVSSLQPDAQKALVTVQNLSVWFPSKKNFFGKPLSYTKAVDDVSFEVLQGETLGLVGESGCGKTTLGRALLRLIDPGSGRIIYNGNDITRFSNKKLKPLRKDIQIIFQDPYSSLNPRISIGAAITEPLKVHGILKTEKQRRDKAVALLEKVNLDASHVKRYPHEFSGGQRQRIVIARALALGPSFVVCDESVSSLDVSIQAQVLNLLNDIKKEFGLTIVFISHDLSVVRYISDRIMVMHRGRIIETGSPDAIWHQPKEAYTRMLLDAIPKAI